MKRVISFALVFCLLVPFGICGAFAEDGSSWELTEFVDDFGDPTGEAYLRSIVKGTFSNTATSEEDMRVILGYDPDNAALTIRIVEYDNTLNVKATYTDSDSKTIKIKIADEITEGILVGTPPNGDLLLTEGPCLIKIYDAFLNGQDVRFIVDINSSRYSFSADGEGFSACLDSYFEANQDRTNGLYYNGTEFIKLEYVLNIRPEYLYNDENSYYQFCTASNAGDIASSYRYTMSYFPSVDINDKQMDPSECFRSYYREKYEKITTTYEELVKIISSTGFSTQDVNLSPEAQGTAVGYKDAAGNMIFLSPSRTADNSDINLIREDSCLIRIIYA